MSDPRRLLDDPGSPEARLLASALDEPPPPDLLARALQASVAAAAGPAIAVSAAPAARAGAAAAKAAGGGILGAAGIGALAGLLTVGAVEMMAGRSAPPPPPAAAVSPAPVTARAVPASASAVPSTTVEEAPGKAAPPSRPPAGSARPSTLALELALLDEARAALGGGDAVRARALLDRYAREIPRGQMAREAALLRAEVDAAIDEATAKERTNP